MKNKRPFGYWKNRENIIKELKRVIRKINHFPSGHNLRKLGEYALVQGLRKYHNESLNYFRVEMGYETVEMKPSGYWKSLDNALYETRKFMRRYNYKTLPNQEELKNLGFSSLVNSIHQYHGGFRKFRKEMGQPSDIKPKGYWNNWKNAEKVLKRLIRETGNFPTQKVLQNLKYSSLANAITNVHGGTNNVRKRLGYEVVKRNNGVLKNIDVVKKEIYRIIKEHPELRGNFPTTNWMKDNGQGSLYIAIQKYHGGYKNFLELMGFEQKQVESGKWKDLEFTIKRYIKIMNEHKFTDFPGAFTLNKIGESSLGAAICKYHGGFPVFRDILNQHLGNATKKVQLEGLLNSYVGGKND
ncbi:MAG: hypothetical protein Q7S27_00245 [Nanoarchaeota archaeon]|nr:hypothetical protein [Nanoarchaeota archaeon]